MKKSIRNQKQRKYRSKHKINTRKKQYYMVGSSILSSSCKQKIKDIFKKYITPSHQFALKYISNELLQKHPIALIEFIKTHFNESVILNKFNNDNCLKIFLNIIKNDFSTHTEKIIKDYSYDEIPLLTMNELVNIVDRGIQKKNLFGGQPPHSDEEEEEEICSICFQPYENPLDILSIQPCGHQFHSNCIRLWLGLRDFQPCPYCRQRVDPLPPLSEEENQQFLILQQDLIQTVQAVQSVPSNQPLSPLALLRLYLNRNFIPGLLGVAMYYSQYFRDLAQDVVMDGSQLFDDNEMGNSQSYLLTTIMMLLILYNIFMN